MREQAVGRIPVSSCGIYLIALTRLHESMGGRSCLGVVCPRRQCGNRGASHKNSNPTHESGWMVQVLSTKEQCPDYAEESHPREWVDGSDSLYREAALVSSGAQSAREGISRSHRKDLKHPHTAVWGIQFLTQPLPMQPANKSRACSGLLHRRLL